MSIYEKEYLRALVKVSNECYDYDKFVKCNKNVYIYKGLLCLFFHSVFTQELDF